MWDGYNMTLNFLCLKNIISLSSACPKNFYILFFATFKEYLIIFSGLTPASAILPENIDIIDLVFLSKEFTVSLICLFSK